MSDAPIEAAARPRRVWIWPALVVALLLVQVIISAVTLTVALSDPGFAVEPDYYNKALQWDESSATDVARAGWTAELSLDAPRGGERSLRLRLRDRDAQPVEHAAVDALFFHHARASERYLATLHPHGAGEYVSELSLDRPGVWEFRCSIRSDGRLLTCRQRIEVIR